MVWFSHQRQDGKFYQLVYRQSDGDVIDARIRLVLLDYLYEVKQIIFVAEFEKQSFLINKLMLKFTTFKPTK